VVSRQNIFGINGNHQNKSVSRICQGAATPSFGPLDHVSSLGPLGARPGVLHDPRVFLNSCHLSIRVQVLLRLFCQEQFRVHRFVRPQLVRLIIHLQFGCFLSCSCLCSSLRRKGLAFLERSIGSVSWLITKGVVVLRLQGSIFRSKARSVCHSPPQRKLPSPDGRSGSPSLLSGN
jgi:hypothetical protein